MSDWPDNATRRSKPVVLAEARRRGLIAPDGGAVWLYIFHDIHGVAHFRHVDRRAWMQMLPDDTGPDAEVHAEADSGTAEKMPVGEVAGATNDNRTDAPANGDTVDGDMADGDTADAGRNDIGAASPNDNDNDGDSGRNGGTRP